MFGEEKSRGTPVVIDNMMFISTRAHIYATESQDRRCRLDPSAGVPASNLFKGVAVGGGMVFYGHRRRACHRAR
jgi:hypothetical protein